MVRRLILLSAAVLIVSAGVARAQDAAAIEKGKQVFTAQKCSLCHSVADKGNKKGPLDDVGTKLSADDIRHWLVNPKEMTAKTKATRQPPMKEYKLAAADLDALVAYLSSLKGK